MAIAKLTQAERKWLDSYRRELRDKHHGDVEQMLLYGSKARGDAGPNSDLDVLLTARNEAAARTDEVRRSGRFGRARLFSQWYTDVRKGKHVVVVVVSEFATERHWII